MGEMTSDVLFNRLVEQIKQQTGKNAGNAEKKDVYYALTAVVNERILQDWKKTKETYEKEQHKQLYYLSMEFLIGRLLKNNLYYCGMYEAAKVAVHKLGFDINDILEQEQDAGLGNGGLGRLAACFLDSLASLKYPGHGFGIRYKYGLFKQRIINGNQVELPDCWLKDPYPWEYRKEDEAVCVRFGGKVHMLKRNDGTLEFKYEDTDQVLAVPYDIPIVGYKNGVVNRLRLWSAEGICPGDSDSASVGDEFYHDLNLKHQIEQISGFLYPDDSTEEGKLLRLKQQYFLVSATIQTIIRDFKEQYKLPLSRLPDKIVIQVNDTHPSLAIPEMMRILMDEERMGWDEAWHITTNVFAYTNHTTMSEALETWPVEMFRDLLPRIFMIVNEINERFCKSIWFDYPHLREKIPEMAIIAYGNVHMARLCIVGSFSVNGVARLHTEILKNKVMNNFYQVFPEKFNNKTNGISHRRWLLQINPKLAGLITEIIGPHWIEKPKQLIHLLRHTKDKNLLEKLAAVKRENKETLAKLIFERTGVKVDPQSVFDVHIKRLHEYKRQLLNIFHIIYLYNELKENPDLDITPRTFIFGAKAAPGYYIAKEIIKLINTVASIVNYDPDVKDKIKVIFLENYNVSLAEKIIPAADVSEQISTASKEASGTGNMKLMMNGALTIGTLDGANVEICELVGKQNIFIFGLTAEEVLDYYENGGYSALDIYNTDERVRKILDQLNTGEFGLYNFEFKDLYYNILYHNDPYFVLKDFESYLEAHELIDQTYRDQMQWMNMSLTNIAHSGKFSSDQTIQEYVNDIWKLQKIR